MVLTGLFFTIFYIIPLVIMPWFAEEFSYISYSNLQIDWRQQGEGDVAFALQIPDRTSDHFFNIWPVGWLFERLKNFLFVVTPEETHGRAHAFLKIRPALMVSYAVFNRITSFFTLRKQSF